MHDNPRYDKSLSAEEPVKEMFPNCVSIVAKFDFADGTPDRIKALIDKLNAIALDDENLYAWEIEEQHRDAR